MNTPGHRFLLALLSVGLVGLLGAGCLGEDYKSLNLVIHDADDGSLAVIEPDEELEAALWDNPVYPGAVWTLVRFDPEVITLADSFYDAYPEGNPAELPPDEREGVPEDQDGVRVFTFVGAALGESPLGFELVSDGEPVGTAGFTIAVVEDACDTDTGLTAPRCRS